MTPAVIASEARRSMTLDCMDCRVATLLAMTCGGVAIASPTVVIPGPRVVIPGPRVVIPDLIRDPVPRGAWIAGAETPDLIRGRNDKCAWCFNDNFG